jgi:uncharacterized protein YprB with RNaseH-like and TPR domain
VSVLSDRIRGIVGTTRSEVPLESRIPNSEPRDLSVLGGEWRHEDGRACFVVERRWEPSAWHGREQVGGLAERLERASAEAPLLAGGAPARPPFVFFDLETTGLSGGAGTYAFLVGCARFEPGGVFVTRQFVLTRYADERPLLETVTGELGSAGALVSFNGKSFDAPVLETRYLFQRLDWIGGRLPHVDILHPARQFWKRKPDAARGFQARERIAERAVQPGSVSEKREHAPSESCSLIALEEHIIGAGRVGDVPGFEIPGRYFQFVRSGDAGPLADVLEHNRLDMLSLAALTARLLHLVRMGPGDARDAQEMLALGRVYERAGLDARAREASERAVEMGGRADTTIDAHRALALALRRSRRYAEAAACWRRLLDVPGCPRHVACEASDALAIHHEHRVRDLASARTFALRSLENVERGLQPARTEAVERRLARIARKMEQPAGLKFRR